MNDYETTLKKLREAFALPERGTSIDRYKAQRISDVEAAAVYSVHALMRELQIEDGAKAQGEGAKELAGPGDQIK